MKYTSEIVSQSPPQSLNRPHCADRMSLSDPPQTVLLTSSLRACRRRVLCPICLIDSTVKNINRVYFILINQGPPAPIAALDRGKRQPKIGKWR